MTAGYSGLCLGENLDSYSRHSLTTQHCLVLVGARCVLARDSWSLWLLLRQYDHFLPLILVL